MSVTVAASSRLSNCLPLEMGRHVAVCKSSRRTCTFNGGTSECKCTPLAARGSRFDPSPLSMRWDKEPSVAQLISSWLRLHCRAVSNLINTSPQTSHASSWLPTSTPTRQRPSHAFALQSNILLLFSVTLQENAKKSPTPRPPIPAHSPFTRQNRNTADSPLRRNNRQFWKTIPRRHCLSGNCSSPEPTSHSSGRQRNFNNGRVCATWWHRARRPRSPGHAAQQTSARCQSAHLEVAVAMWRANCGEGNFRVQTKLPVWGKVGRSMEGGGHGRWQLH